MMLTRYSSATGLGAIATFGLLSAMQALIVMQPGAASEPRARHDIDFVRVREPEEIRTDDIRRPDELIKQPETVTPRVASELGGDLDIGVPASLPPVPGDAQSATAFRISDGPLVVIVRVQPVYPAVAEARGLEGWVLVQFDVLPDGRVANAFVVESSSRIFERAALSAAGNFRYKARVLDGMPIATRGIQNLFRFEMPPP
jgi:protein TonB